MNTFFTELNNEGYIYCLYNEAFEKFKNDSDVNVYKLGLSRNLKKRLSTYTTYYIKPSSFMCTSKDYDRKFKDCVKAERVLFYILRKFRVSNKREFFQCDIKIIKDTISRISSFSDEMIDEMYKGIMGKICPPDIIERIEDKNLILTNKEWFEFEKGNNDSIFKFLEQFRFRPKDPSKYPNYVSPEQLDLCKLMFPVKREVPMFHSNEDDVLSVKIKYLEV